MGGESVEIEGEPGPVEDDDPDGGRAELLRRLEGLSDLHRAVLVLRFGLGGEEPLKLREVADRLGCSRQNVHQLEAQGLRRLGLEKAGGPRSMAFRPAAGRRR
jgi:DNA-directed RNA polymerase sigma subunit (sigma70/sigma32)